MIYKTDITTDKKICTMDTLRTEEPAPMKSAAEKNATDGQNEISNYRAVLILEKKIRRSFMNIDIPKNY